MGIWEILGNRVDWQGFIGSRAHVLRHGLMGHQAFVHAWLFHDISVIFAAMIWNLHCVIFIMRFWFNIGIGWFSWPFPGHEGFISGHHWSDQPQYLVDVTRMMGPIISNQNRDLTGNRLLWALFRWFMLILNPDYQLPLPDLSHTSDLPGLTLISPVPLQDVDGRCFFGYSGAAKACGWFVQMLHFVSKDLVSSKYGPSLRFLGCKICTAKLLCILSILQISEQLSWASTRTLWGEKKKHWITLLVFSLRGGPVTRQLAPYAPGDTFAVCFDWFLRPTPKDQSHLRVGRQRILPKVLGIVRTKGKNFASSHPDVRFTIEHLFICWPNSTTLGGWFQTFFVVQPSRDYDPNWLHLVLGFYVLTFPVRLMIFSECPYAVSCGLFYMTKWLQLLRLVVVEAALHFWCFNHRCDPQLAIEVRLFVRVYDSPQRAKSRGSREEQLGDLPPTNIGI